MWVKPISLMADIVASDTPILANELNALSSESSAKKQSKIQWKPFWLATQLYL